ncbi:MULTISPECIES: hypothetical protein [unclassified Bartonella]
MGAFVVRAGGERRNERAQVLFHCGDNGVSFLGEGFGGLRGAFGEA